MEGVVVDYFQNLFISSNPHAIDEVVELVDRNVKIGRASCRERV